MSSLNVDPSNYGSSTSSNIALVIAKVQNILYRSLGIMEICAHIILYGVIFIIVRQDFTEENCD